jgi:nucleoside-diphosphate-sugar epimerase
MNHLFCFGLGYTAKRLIMNLKLNSLESWNFSGTSRSKVTFASTKIYIFDGLLILPEDITHILISIPPKESGDIVYGRFYAQIARFKRLKWLGYLSSTGVYGDHRGGWVSENSEISLSSIHGRSRLVAENQWLQTLKEGIPTHIFRIAGIYGPGRSALENAVAGKLNIIDKADTIFSRIHVGDIANALSLSINNPSTGSIYNLADDYPCNPREVGEFACQILGISPPKAIPLEEADLSKIGKEFYMQSRRVSNDKIKSELGLKLLYPTYKEGLLSIAKECGYQVLLPC